MFVRFLGYSRDQISKKTEIFILKQYGSEFCGFEALNGEILFKGVFKRLEIVIFRSRKMSKDNDQEFSIRAFEECFLSLLLEAAALLETVLFIYMEPRSF